MHRRKEIRTADLAEGSRMVRQSVRLSRRRPFQTSPNVPLTAPDSSVQPALSDIPVAATTEANGVKRKAEEPAASEVCCLDL